MIPDHPNCRGALTPVFSGEHLAMAVEGRYSGGWIRGWDLIEKGIAFHPCRIARVEYEKGV
jgi:hypothetical protein